VWLRRGDEDVHSEMEFVPCGIGGIGGSDFAGIPAAAPKS
jgi:hypothetical protein